MTQTLLIRTDGSSEMGTGHVMRCLTLAQTWSKDDGRVKFVGSIIPDGLRERIIEWCDSVDIIEPAPGSTNDAARTKELIDVYNVDWVVIDGEHFGAAYLEELTEGTARVLHIDDTGQLSHYSADIVLNQNLHADPDMYSSRDQETELLLGSEYLLLRDEFLEWLDWSPDASSTPENLLVTLGGSDPDDATLTVVEALDLIATTLDVRVIVGAANDSCLELDETADAVDHRIRFEQNVSDMAKQMAWADLAVSSGGTTCWELAYMGVPTVVGTIAPIEEHLVAGLQNAELFSHVGSFNKASKSEIATALTRLINDDDYRVRMSVRGQEVVDGYGRCRTVKTMYSYQSFAENEYI